MGFEPCSKACKCVFFVEMLSPAVNFCGGSQTRSAGSISRTSATATGVLVEYN